MKAIIIFFTIIGTLFGGGLTSSEQKNGDFHIYTVDNKELKITPKMIEQSLKSNGFIIGENANIQAEILHIYGEDNFKIYNNISFYHPDLTLQLLNTHPDAGILVPMGMVIYQNLNEDDLHIVVSRGEMQAKVLGINKQELQALEDAILKVITELFPTASHSYSDNSKMHDKEFLTKYTLEIEGDDDVEDIREELEENFEEKFGEAGFAMPSYFDLTDSLGENSPYDFYVTYAICKMDVLRVVLKIKPEIAVLGPCTTMIYKKKGESKIVMGFGSIYNWISSTNLEDKVSVDTLLALQKEYEAILKDVTKN